MSALGQKATSQDVSDTSALTPKADINRRRYDLRFVPIASDALQKTRPPTAAVPPKFIGYLDWVLSTATFRVRRQPRKPAAPTPLANNGKAVGSGVVAIGCVPVRSVPLDGAALAGEASKTSWNLNG